MQNSNIFLEHILQSIELIEDYTRNLTINDFLSEEFVHNAVIQRIKVISESVNYLSEDFKELYPQIPWKTIGGVKETLENQEVDLEDIWETIENEIPLLKKEILRVNEVKLSY
ncbi:HepT-like ribonuclease domain-containing protein [Methanobacterium sp. ACI-7]|uniref:HepT-like ribonuclease domain-containing protein n=1 Tax=unclassified Methanobacterium TaxID=2627676 RepID=UPI0039C14B04